MKTQSPHRYTQDEIIRCAWLYYVQDYTQEEVAQKLEMSRARVVRLLKEAKARGLVQVKINASVGLLALAEQVHQLYRPLALRRVHLVPTMGDDGEQKMAIAREFPSVFSPRNDAVIAVSWGTTLSYALEMLPVHGSTGKIGSNLTVVSVLGGIQGGIRTANPYDIAFRLGQKLHARVYTLQAPAFVRDREVAALLLREESLQETLEVSRSARIALFGAGDLSESSTLERINAISSEERKWLVGQGAVGDLLGHFLDREGRELDLDGRITAMSLSLDDLKRIPERICLGGGPNKREIILAMLRGGYITTLVTDEATAQYLIAHAPPATQLAPTGAVAGS
jgi:DNA-binding transcriptional regulator LsrR (DeoR family)